MPTPHRLISVCFSHYVERARWGLERFGVDYEEEPHMPLLHVPAVWRVHRGRAGRADKASTRMSTPVLVTPDGPVFTDSRQILDYLDREYAPAGRALYPDASLAAEEQRWHDRLAPHARRLAYVACFRSAQILPEIARRNVGGWEASVFKHGLGLIELGMRRYLSMDETAAQRSEDICWVELDRVAALLEDGRPYLGGEHFSGWDLSLACFAAPVLLPPEFGAWIPGPERLDPKDAELVARARAHPAGQHALRMFAEHRHVRVSG